MDDGIRFGSRVHLGKEEPFSKLTDRSIHLEKHGFDTALLDDHQLYGTSVAQAPDPFTSAASILTSTKQLRVGVAVTDTVRREPVILAQSAGTVNSIAPGRFILGLGAGDPMNRTPFGLPVDHQFARFREGVEVLKLLSTARVEKPVDYSGQFHRLKSAYIQVGPLPPLYFAAFGEKMLRFTGEEADGWIPHCHTPESYQKDLEKVLGSARRNSRKDADVHPSYYTVASVSKDRETARASVLGPARYFLALNPEALSKLDPTVEHPGRVWEKTVDPREQRRTLSGIASRIPEDLALGTAIHGTSSDCIEQISQYVEHGCKEFYFMFAGPRGLWSGDDAIPMVELFGKEVIGYFNES